MTETWLQLRFRAHLFHCQYGCHSLANEQGEEEQAPLIEENPFGPSHSIAVVPDTSQS